MGRGEAYVLSQSLGDMGHPALPFPPHSTKTASLSRPSARSAVSKPRQSFACHTIGPTGTQMAMPWILGIWTVSHAVHKCSHSLSQLFSSNIHILNMYWSFDKGLCPNTFLNKIKASPQKAHSPPFPVPSWICDFLLQSAKYLDYRYVPQCLAPRQAFLFSFVYQI